MDKIVIAALITSTASIVVSVSTAIGQMLLFKDKVNSTKGIKQTECNVLRSADVLREKCNSLVEACKAIQEYRDKILFVANGSNGSLLCTEAKDILNESLNSLTATYAKAYIYLDEKYKNIFHNSKNIAITCYTLFETYSKKCPEMLSLHNEEVADLLTIRSDLGEFQNRLYLKMAEYLTRFEVQN